MLINKHFLFACIFCMVCSPLLQVSGWKEGETLNVYVVPHSHNDPGWWNTFEDYYRTWTKGILDSVVTVLSEDPQRTFIWAEMSFFQRWWSDQTDTVKAQTKKLVENKQLEFVTAGWVMNDEANAHVIDIINQLTEGHEWLYNNLGTKPTIGWSIDPFGHSPTMAYVLQAMGFKAMVINRIHKDKKAEFRNNKQLEFYWRGENNETGPSFDMMTHVFPWKLYDIPNTCGPDWDVCERYDFERPVSIPITQKNIVERTSTLVNQYKKKAELFGHNHVLIPLGDDFKYKTADMTRKIMSQYQMMFDHINKDKSMNTNIKFTTLSDYFSAVRKWEEESKSASSSSAVSVLPTYQGDFFTYCDEDQDYWSGYFTTRPFMKGMTRSTQSVLQTGEALYVLQRAYAEAKGDTSPHDEWFKAIERSRGNLGIFQHHDGVTGTARVAVVRDYAQRLHDSMWGVADAASEMARSLLSKSKDISGETAFVWSHTPSGPSLSPAPRVLPAEGISVILAFNPLQHDRKEVISAYVASNAIKVTGANGQHINVQLDPVWIGDSISTDKFQLHFIGEVPAMGFSTYFVHVQEKDDTTYSIPKHASVKEYTREPSKNEGDWKVETEPLSALSASALEISNQQYTVTFDGHGFIKQLKRKVTGSNGEKQLKMQVEQDFLSYSTHRSGAYLFLPLGPASQSHGDVRSVRVIQGPIVKYVSVTLNASPVSDYTVRLYDCEGTSAGDKSTMSSMVEILHTLDMSNGYGNTEVVTRYSTDIKNNNLFFTDSNGLDMRKREYENDRPIQANYYPITSAAYIEEAKFSGGSKSRLTVLVHQAHGAGSIQPGSLEVMLDRRLNQDDARGLGEPVNDNVRTPIPLWLVLEDVSEPANDPNFRPALTPTSLSVWQIRNYPIQQFYSSEATHQLSTYTDSHRLTLSPLKKQLPPHVQVMTFAPRMQSNDVILRVFAPSSTQSQSSSKVGMSLDLFGAFKPVGAKESSLSLMYDNKDAIITSSTYSLRPSQIRTFLFTLKGSIGAGDEDLDRMKEKTDKNNNILIDDEKEEEEAKKGAKNTGGGVVDEDQQLPIPVIGGGGDGQVGKEDDDHGHQKDNLPAHDPKKQTGGKGEQPLTSPERENDENSKTESGKGRATANLYAISMVMYVSVALCMFAGGWVCRSRSKKGGSVFSWNTSQHTEREASVMKML